MCEKCGCIKTDEKEEKPETCTPEQVEECHPDADDHPCEDK